jgi:hypothetical protein
MSESDQFGQYAEEAQLWIAQAKTEEEKQVLVELMCTWTAAAVAARRCDPARQTRWRTCGLIQSAPLRFQAAACVSDRNLDETGNQKGCPPGCVVYVCIPAVTPSNA